VNRAVFVSLTYKTNNMIQTLNTSQAAHLLLADEYAGWTYSGAHALVEYLEDLEDQLEVPIEFDTVAIRCDYSEYTDISEVYDDYSEAENSKEMTDQQMLDWLKERTQVIEFDGGIIVQSF